MDKYKDYTSEDFLANDSFIHWLKEGDKESQEYWKKIMEKHPSKKKEIEQAKEVFKILQVEQDHLEINDIYKILNTLQKQAKTEKNRFFIQFMKYAAIFVLVFASGALSYYLFQQSNQYHYELADETSIADDEAKIILGDGSQISLEQKISEISYNHEGNQLVINNDTINQILGDEKESINRIIIPYGKKSMIELSDGTKVWLNAGSQLVYPSRFLKKNRQVLLIGEAYFDVERDEARPFIVQTKDVNVNVLGTKFDVSAYPEDKYVETILEEGKVCLHFTGKNMLERDRKIVMEPNQKITLDRENGETMMNMVDVNMFTSWKDGMFIFEREDLIRAVKKIERYYNIKIRLADPLIGGFLLSGKLDLKKQPEEVLNVIKLTVPIDWHKKSNGDFVLLKK